MIGAVDEVAAGSGIDRRRAAWEILLVLGVSLGQAAIYSLLRIVERLTRNVPLAQQTSTLNASATPDRPWLDLAYQLVGIAFALVPAILTLYLLQLSDPPAGERIGFDLRRPAFDVGRGLLLALAIGLPGLGLYVGARDLGWNTQVQASGLGENWWTIPVLILSAAQNAFVEEVIVVGFLFTRLGQLGWRVPVVIATSAAVRGAYHLYQGFGGLLGNLLMGVVFGLVYLRWKRVGPLVVAHTVLDIAAFVGYALLAPRLSWL
jgi:membrane protease YdiL (CAAX protease family)